MEEAAGVRPVFDPARNIDVLMVTPEGDKTVTVRNITDEQYERRKRSQRVTIKDLGRGVSESDVSYNEDVDGQIVTELRVGDTAEVDGAEAGRILDLISDAEAVDAVREGPAFRIFVKVPGCTTEHLVKVPAQRRLMEYRRIATRVLHGNFGRKEIRVNYQAAGALYDDLCAEVTGYAAKAKVPLAHKAAAITAALQALDREQSGEADDPNY